MAEALYIVYALAHLALFAWGVAIYRQTRRIGTFFILAVILGTFYDNLILAMGLVLGEGSLLQSLSLGRFIAQQFMLPWLIVAVWEQAYLAGQAWAAKTWARYSAWALTLLVIVTGAATRLVGLELVYTELDGVARYIAERSAGPPLASFLSIGVALVVGLLLWRKNGWAWLFWACVIVFIGEGAIPDRGLRLVIGSGVEVIFVYLLLRTEVWLLHWTKQRVT
jgi:hypothetical protein